MTSPVRKSGSLLGWAASATVSAALFAGGAAAALLQPPVKIEGETQEEAAMELTVAMISSEAAAVMEANDPPQMPQMEPVEPPPDLAVDTPPDMPNDPVTPPDVPDVEQITMPLPDMVPETAPAPPTVEALDIAKLLPPLQMQDFPPLAAPPPPPPEPEVVEKKPEPKPEPKPEKKPEPKKKPEPVKEKAKTQAKEKKPAKEKVAEAPPPVKKAEKAANASNGSTGAEKASKKRKAGGVDPKSYGKAVRRKIAKQKQRRVSGKGTVVISFSVSGSGGLASVGVTQSSGDAALDAAALDQVRRAAPFAAPPPGASASFTVPIKFD